MLQPFSSALYYPYIDINDSKWLYQAALFYGKIRTIVPESIGNPYRNSVSRQFFDEGVLEPVYVNSDLPEVRSMASDVVNYMNESTGRELLYWENSEGIHPEKIPTEIRMMMKRDMPDKYDVIAQKMRRYFERMDDMHGWYKTNPRFAQFYMTLLATRLSERLGIATVTSEAAMDAFSVTAKKGRILARQSHEWRRGFDLYEDRIDIPRGAVRGLLVDLILAGIQFRDEVPVGEIVAFRRNYSSELGAMKNAITDLVSDVPDAVSLEAAREIVNQKYNDIVKPSVSNLEKAINGQKWNVTFDGCTKLTVLSCSATSALIALGLSTPMALLVAGGVSMAATTANFAVQRRNLIIQSPYSFLLLANKELGSG